METGTGNKIYPIAVDNQQSMNLSTNTLVLRQIQEINSPKNENAQGNTE